jgi:predicted RNase H-like HicB family nuclease
MKEIIFEVTEEVEDGFTASAVGLGIHTQADSVDELRAMVREAVDCYFDENDPRPALIRLH